jgi:transposase
MTNLSIFVGIDTAHASFTGCVFKALEKSVSRPQTWANCPEGFIAFGQWLKEQGADPAATVICLENTGVYGEALSYTLAAQGWRLAVEAPHAIKKAMSPDHRKSDDIDCRQIAEYAYRYADRLSVWTPPEPVLEQLQVLLTTREQYVEQMTAHKNTLTQIRLKVVRTPLAEESLTRVIDGYKEQIQRLDQEMKKLVSGHPTFGPLNALVTSIPGVGFLLATNLLVLTKGFAESTDPRRLASRLGVCPLPCQSGTSLYKRDRARRYGHHRLRKLLHLAAMSLRTHNQLFKLYFLRKVQEGKPKLLVLNNIANKLLRVICAVVNSKTPFIDNYKSVNPMFLHA